MMQQVMNANVDDISKNDVSVEGMDDIWFINEVTIKGIGQIHKGVTRYSY